MRKENNLVFISLSNKTTLKNSIHAYILEHLSKKFQNIFVFCWGKKSYQNEGNVHYFNGNILNWFSYLNKTPSAKYVYINDFFIGGVFGVYIKRIKRIPLLFRCGSPWKYKLSSISSIFKTLLVVLTKPLVIKNCDKVVYNAKAVIQKEYKHNYVVIYNGIDTELFKPSKVNKSPRHNQIKKLKILFVGNLNKEKGLDYLFTATNEIKDKVNLSVVGDGQLFNSYKKRFCYANFFGRVPRKELPEIINNNHVLILPTFVESFPNVLLEAMACAKPVIATNVYGIPEMVTNKENGFLIPPHNPLAIENALNNFIDNPLLLEKMGKKARKVVEKRFDKEKQMQKLYNAFFQQN